MSCRVVVTTVHFVDPEDAEFGCDDCGCVLFGEAGVVVEHKGCGHVSGYCGDCATWRFLRSDAESHGSDTQVFLDWRDGVAAGRFN